jgi:hypothetical protein
MMELSEMDVRLSVSVMANTYMTLFQTDAKLVRAPNSVMVDPQNWLKSGICVFQTLLSEVKVNFCRTFVHFLLLVGDQRFDQIITS